MTSLGHSHLRVACSRPVPPAPHAFFPPETTTRILLGKPDAPSVTNHDEVIRGVGLWNGNCLLIPTFPNEFDTRDLRDNVKVMLKDRNNSSQCLSSHAWFGIVFELRLPLRDARTTSYWRIVPLFPTPLTLSSCYLELIFVSVHVSQSINPNRSGTTGPRSS